MCHSSTTARSSSDVGAARDSKNAAGVLGDAVGVSTDAAGISIGAAAEVIIGEDSSVAAGVSTEAAGISTGAAAEAGVGKDSATAAVEVEATGSSADAAAGGVSREMRRGFSI